MPHPVEHGGMFDLFHKLPALHAAGVRIHLHCFSKNKQQSAGLNSWCEEVRYYPRRTGLRAISFSYPYIVRSRMNEELNMRLLQDDYPILLEGIHCAAILNDRRFEKRRIILRLHNIESVYYRQLYRSRAPLPQKIYYLWESRLLEKFEKKVIPEAGVTVCVAMTDQKICLDRYRNTRIQYLPVFAGFDKVSGDPGTGAYVLYHGNLSVGENETAVRWLVSEVFSKVDYPLVIAGKDPSPALAGILSNRKNVRLAANPSPSEMDSLIARAQIHVLPSFNSTGVKLKLIHALFRGRHCLVNAAGVQGSGLEDLCVVCSGAEEFVKAVTDHIGLPFTSDDIKRRAALLEEMFNDRKNAEKLIRWIW